jgi:cytochrome P450
VFAKLISKSKIHFSIRSTLMQDTAMILNLWSFHHDPKFWGDPEEFRPERFLDEKGNLNKKDYSLPFGAGQ